MQQGPRNTGGSGESPSQILGRIFKALRFKRLVGEVRSLSQIAEFLQSLVDLDTLPKVPHRHIEESATENDLAHQLMAVGVTAADAKWFASQARGSERDVLSRLIQDHFTHQAHVSEGSTVTGEVSSTRAQGSRSGSVRRQERITVHTWDNENISSREFDTRILGLITDAKDSNSGRGIRANELVKRILDHLPDDAFIENIRARAWKTSRRLEKEKKIKITKEGNYVYYRPTKEEGV